ncbi:MAG: YmdB family metallophosphoesterase [Treponema sp.]|jgi:metallophosphoesterase (TIGR00282 family)|nr:YmdB family metallophosphoesterase [Treponema sp.]
MGRVRALMVGDVVGDPGLLALEAALPGLIQEHRADFVVVNGENAAGGFGLSADTLARILAAGADVVTSGNHIWEKRDFWPVLEIGADRCILRPANYPVVCPGRGWFRLEKAGTAWAVINLQGRELMTLIDCPFKTFDAIYQEISGEKPPLPIIIVDFHAESTREKEALGLYLDGRAALMAGTHTHVQTADEQLLPGGTAYMTDLGMTGARESILGMDSSICLNRARNQVLYRMEAAKSVPGQELTCQGVLVEIDAGTGKAVSIHRIRQ